MSLDWIFLPRENPCAKFCIIIIIIIIPTTLLRRETKTKTPHSSVSPNQNPTHTPLVLSKATSGARGSGRACIYLATAFSLVRMTEKNRYFSSLVI